MQMKEGLLEKSKCQWINKYAGNGGIGKLAFCSHLESEIGSIKNHQLMLKLDPELEREKCCKEHC